MDKRGVIENLTEGLEDFLIAFHQGEFIARNGLVELAKRVSDLALIVFDEERLVDCQSCKHHHCYYDNGIQDCSCDLSVLTFTQTYGIPNSCPLLTIIPLREAIRRGFNND